MIKLFLLAAVFFAIFKLAFGRRLQIVRASKKALFFLIAVSSIVSICNPDLVSYFAQLLGVGRGADLVLYLTVIVVLFNIFNNYLERRSSMLREGILVREVAFLRKEIEIMNSNNSRRKDIEEV